MKRRRITDNYADLFEKQYKFRDTSTWQLPQKCFDQNNWQIQSLQSKKQKLNATKEKLNDYNLATWSWHTKKRDPSTRIVKEIRESYNAELPTQAFCKFYECLSRYDLIHPNTVKKGCLNSLHLCEAPGGFITSLNHYLKTKYINFKLHWLASTLNPMYEGNSTDQMIPDDRFIANTQQSWLFGADHTGDIMKYYNYKAITQKVLEKFPEKVDLITADGSVDCSSDPGNQESHVVHLHYCEVITALTVLKPGGNFILKIFTTFEAATISILYLLNCVFTSVSIIKPITSKSGNSETYVINQGFKGFDVSLSQIWDQILLNYQKPNQTKSLFRLCDIPKDFLTQIEECAEYFMCLQISTIQENINNFGFDSKQCNSKLSKYQQDIVHEFLNLYPIQAIHSEYHISPAKIYKRPIGYTPLLNSSFKVFDIEKHNEVSKTLTSNIIYGKKLDKVLYSKFTPLNDNLNFRKFKNLEPLTKNSLFLLCKTKTTNFFNAHVIDCSYFPHNQSAIHHKLFKLIFESFTNNKNMLIINLSLITNFTVGLLWILSRMYTVYFFKHGIIYLKLRCDVKFDLEPNINVHNLLQAINDALVNITKREDFEVDILEVIDLNGDYCSLSTFFRCVYFYNKQLCLNI